jgi:hypothetical protein
MRELAATEMPEKALGIESNRPNLNQESSRETST